MEQAERLRNMWVPALRKYQTTDIDRIRDLLEWNEYMGRRCMEEEITRIAWAFTDVARSLNWRVLKECGGKPYFMNSLAVVVLNLGQCQPRMEWEIASARRSWAVQIVLELSS